MSLQFNSRKSHDILFLLIFLTLSQCPLMVEKIQLKSFGKKQTQKRKKGVYLQNIPLNLTRSLHHISSTHFLVYASVSFRLLSQSLQTLKRKWASWATAADILVGSISKSIHHHIVMFHLCKNNFLHKQLLQNFCPNIQYIL